MTDVGEESIWRIIVTGRMWLTAVMGFASGLPILLTLTVLQAWLTDEGVNLATIGLLALIALPYNVKFLWAPLLDRFNPLALGRRRSWLVITQVSLALSLAAMAMQNPEHSFGALITAACLVAIFSATQDVVIDAYRREALSDREQGPGASMYVYGYRFGTLLAGAGGLILADLVGFHGVYLIMAAVMISMVAATLLAPEPTGDFEQPRSLRKAYAGPFLEFISRYETAGSAVILLAFVLLYNLGIQFSGHLTVPFYLAIGFSNTEIGTLTALFGIAPYLLGVFVGGALQLKVGQFRSLLITGVLKAVAIMGLALLSVIGQDTWWLAIIMSAQSFALGMGTTVLMALIANITNPRFTATQFALFTALAALPRSVLTAPTGWIVTEIGWTQFFVLSILLTLPGIGLLLAFADIFTRTESGLEEEVQGGRRLDLD